VVGAGCACLWWRVIRRLGGWEWGGGVEKRNIAACSSHHPSRRCASTTIHPIPVHLQHQVGIERRLDNGRLAVFGAADDSRVNVLARAPVEVHTDRSTSRHLQSRIQGPDRTAHRVAHAAAAVV